jgi:hypothetical protein
MKTLTGKERLEAFLRDAGARADRGYEVHRCDDAE